MKLSAFDTYCLFLALKNHFTRENYDFFRYHGKGRVNNESFMSRRDRFQFEKMSRLYSHEEMRDAFVSNFIKDKTWIGDMITEEAHSNFIEYRRRHQSLSYTFSNELDNLFTKENPEKVFKTTRTSFAPILTYIIREDVSMETAVILDHFIGFSKNFDSLFEKHQMKIQRYAPFVVFDKNKMKTILKEKLHEYGLPSQRQKESKEKSRQGEKAPSRTEEDRPSIF